MATLQLDLLECIHPDDPVGHDEIRVIVSCDGELARYDPELRMNEGDIADLSTPEGYEFNDVVVIRLEESDPLRREILGSVTITHPLPEGPQTAFLPSVIGGPHATCYRLTYHVDAPDEAARARNRIELLTLTCDNAQGSYDTVNLYVNEDQVLGPANMRSEQVIDLGELAVDFHSSATIRLEETRGQNWESEHTFRPGDADYVINRERTLTFHVDRGVTGDATYSLRYRLRWLPAR